MTGASRSVLSIVALALAVSLAAGCSTRGGAPGGRATTPSTDATSPVTHTRLAASSAHAATAVPMQVSDFPNGVYRSQLSVKRLQTAGFDDPSNAGIWTLTVKSGSYRLDCLTIADPGIDCGNHSPSLSPTVEIGTVRGTSPTIWFVHDQARLSKLTGCIRHSEGDRGCGPEGGYHLNWRAVPGGVTFSSYVGLGDEAGPVLGIWLTQIWTRIS